MKFAPRKHWWAFGLALAGITIAFGYQNCSRAQFAWTNNGSNVAAGLSVDPGDVNITPGSPTSNLILTIVPKEPTTTAILVSTNPTCSGARYQSAADPIEYTLPIPNALNIFYVRTQTAEGAESICFEKRWVHDSIAPTLTLVDHPPAVTTDPNADFRLEARDDGGTGIDRITCKLDGGEWEVCNDIPRYTNLTEGEHRFSARAYDMAGNESPVVQWVWRVDRTPPFVRITSGPAPNDSIEFVGDDGVNGSGIAEYRCYVDSSAPVVCSSPHSVAGLPPGNHTFGVVAVDGAGNVSPPARVDWTVSPPSLGLVIAGITGPSDSSVDAYLRGLNSPWVNVAFSSSVTALQAAILNGSGSTRCGPISVGPTGVIKFNSACSLSEGQSYDARVVASGGGASSTQTFRFLVDSKAPVITVTSVKDDDEKKETTIKYSVVDSSPITELVCHLKSPSGKTTSRNCIDAREIMYPDLPLGSYEFKVTGKDSVGLSGTSNTYKFMIKGVACDPLGNPISKGGVTVIKRCTSIENPVSGDLYYLTGSQRKNPPMKVDEYIQIGKQVPVKLRLSQVNVPPRKFSEGFRFVDGSYARDENGNILTEYFAMDMKAIFKLASSDSDGYYQFMILSDDGVVAEGTYKGNNVKIIDNDGDHPPEYGCSGNLQISKSDRIPLRVKYYQGPRYEISLVMLYRKVSSSGSSKDEYCGKGSTISGYKSQLSNLQKRGWKVIPGSNFLTAE